MGNNWTTEQDNVIRHSEGNLLVAAAAGSGKTAVLVERIVTMLQDREHPIDIDRMLVVTFTRAAAAEMKERIGKRISELIMEQEDNEQLQRQQLLLHHARITTIDSFCMQVVREFFHMTDLDPGFRIGDETEMRLLRSDVLKEVLEANYKMASESFLRLVECYAPGKTDAAIEDYIMKLHLFSESYEWPEKWLAALAEDFCYEDKAAFEQSELLRSVMEEVRRRTALALQEIRLAEEIVNEAALEGYRATVQADRKFLEELSLKSDYVSYSQCVRNYEFSTIGRCSKDVDAEAREQAKALRDQCKETVNHLIKNYFFQKEQAMYEDMVICASHMQELVRLTLEFRQKYSETKRDKNLLDFSDLGHFALQILVEEKDGEYVPTEAAGILRGRFDRIMVDEYQDSNQIQERLLWAVSGVHNKNADHPKGQPNVFTVGDVKQSIYGFRQARPQLFMDKYDAYGQGDPAYQKIILKANFRSRPHVLDAVNSVFEWCMHKNFGRIEYDADAALHAGLPYEVCSGTISPYDPELLLVHHETLPDEEAVEKIVAEAKACAERIRGLIGEDGLLITEKGVARRAKAGDVAILLRSAKGWAETFVAVLKDMGIHATAAVSSGFFETGEIVTTLNYLKILDNPKQDIPLAQILLSPLGGFTNNELAQIKCSSGKLYDVIRAYVAKEETNTELLQKVRAFLEMYDVLRQRMKYLSVAELLLEIYRKTGLYELMSALPAGEQRIANLEYLLLQAQKFAATSYHGVFQFVRYVEKLKDNEMDLGEASTVQALDAVKIMTIHKSKGLEFPIVLVPGCGKMFNQTDANTRIVLHADYGLGPDCIDSELRTRMVTLKKQYIRQMLRQETIAEELRMLYVAMTRAREKLILVGSIGDVQKFMDSCAAEGKQIAYRNILSANCYLDFVKGAILREFAGRDFASLSEDNPMVVRTVTTGNQVVWHMLPIKAGKIEPEDCLEFLEDEQKKARLMEVIQNPEQQEGDASYAELKQCASYRYPFEQATMGPLKTSVSELKRRSMQTEDDRDESEVPKWLYRNCKKDEKRENESGISAAERGTLYHKILERMPFTNVRTEADLLCYHESLVNSGRMTRDEVACIEPERLMRFLKSELAERIRHADQKSRLKKEQPFVLGVETEEGSGDYELIQGIIDLYFEEDDGCVLVDYKTDRIEDAEELAERYRIQLMYYARAIEQITGKTVKDIYIYSLHLSQVIRLE